MLSRMGRLSVPDRPTRERQNVPYGLCETRCRRGTELAPERARWCKAKLSAVDRGRSVRGLTGDCRSSRRQGMRDLAVSAVGVGWSSGGEGGRRTSPVLALAAVDARRVENASTPMCAPDDYEQLAHRRYHRLRRLHPFAALGVAGAE